MSTHRLTLQVHVDDEELERQRAAYIEANPDDLDLDNFYGRPGEWSSILDVVDAQEAAVILRSELVDQQLDVEPFDPYRKPASRWRRLLAKVGVGAVLALAFTGTASADTIRGTGSADWLYGTAGYDRILGFGGPDQLFGRGGGDDLEGHRGNDWLRGQMGDDWLWGGRGRDTVNGGRGYDVCFGGPGPDLFLDCNFLVDFSRRQGDRAGGIFDLPPLR